MNGRPRIFVSRPDIPGTALQRLASFADVDVWPREGVPPRVELLGRVRDADGMLCVVSERIDEELLENAPHLKIVANMAVGFDNIDVPLLRRRGVVATNTPGVLTETTADLTLALMLAFARRIVEGERIVREGRWPAWTPSFFLGRDLHDTTLGIIGLGAIGLAVARRARAFNMRVLYWSRSAKPEAEALGLERTSLEAVLRNSDWVSLHLALDAETRGFLGRGQIGAMKRDAVLVNTARGALVDETALVEALREGRIAGAALDVFEREPLPVDHPLLSLDNVLVAPHVGSATLRTRTAMADLAADNLFAFFSGRPLLTPLT